MVRCRGSLIVLREVFVMSSPEFISLNQASALFGPSRTMLKRKIRAGELRTVRFSAGDKLFVRASEVQAPATAVQPHLREESHRRVSKRD
jgi:hypothetical protein